MERGGLEDRTMVLEEVANPTGTCNWVLLVPDKLELLGAGCGGIAEMKQWLPPNKVLFGALRFTFPRQFDAPPIVKHAFLHWIGPEVSAVRRGQWNSKLADALSLLRKSCDFAFRTTAYSLEDLELQHLISELRRLTYDTTDDNARLTYLEMDDFDRRQISVAWYLEGLDVAREKVGSVPVGGLLNVGTA